MLSTSHLDNSEDATVGASNAETSQAPQDRLALFVHLLLTRERDDGEIGSRDGVDDGKQGRGLGGGRQEEEPDRLVVEFRDAGGAGREVPSARRFT